MAEYIDKEKLLLRINEIYCKDCSRSEACCRSCWVDDTRLEIADAPTEDVVEVVRCKDCENSTRHDGYSCYCNYFLDYVSLNGFCSYGEKMDGKDGEGK